MPTAVPVTPPLAVHGEGPVASPDRTRLLWLDMTVGDVLVTDIASGDTARWPTGSDHVALIRPTVDGGWIAALDDRVATADALHTGWTVAPWRLPGPDRFNEGGCDPSGRLYVGTADPEETRPIGRLYLLTATGPITVLDGVTVSNGLAWSDPVTAYYIDSVAGSLDRLDFDDPAEPPHRTPLVTIAAGDQLPDGLALDTDGGAWVAVWGGACVRRYDLATGAVTDVVELPCPDVTACSFGGPDLTSLYITTSRLGSDRPAHRGGGSLFVTVPGVTGQPIAPAVTPLLPRTGER